MLIEDYVKGKEVAELLRKLLDRSFDSVELVNDEKSMSDVYTGHFPFILNGYEIWIFSNCYDFDHVAYVLAPDGREGDRGMWNIEDDDQDPMNILSKGEIYKLGKLFKKIR